MYGSSIGTLFSVGIHWYDSEKDKIETPVIFFAFGRKEIVQRKRTLNHRLFKDASSDDGSFVFKSGKRFFNGKTRYDGAMSKDSVRENCWFEETMWWRIVKAEEILETVFWKIIKFESGFLLFWWLLKPSGFLLTSEFLIWIKIKSLVWINTLKICVCNSDSFGKFSV